jgi:uncharacterized repeat protein (TIGR01451 family)
VQVDRDAVRSTVFQWVTAGGEPGRVAVVFAGTETDGNPNFGTFNASWNIYVNQSLNALASDATFSQVKATTHPFHYDSICLNGLGCDLSVPPGDRSMADFFSLDYNPVDKKIYVTFNRSNKKPDEDLGHIASPMVVTQIGGPSLGGGTISSTRPVLRTSSTDLTGDALSSYSILAPAVVPPDPPTANEPAADFVSVSIGPELNLATNAEVANGGFTATIKVANLSNAALGDTMTRTGSQSLLWVLRFTNGHQDAAAAARWNPTDGFTFGYNNFATGSAPCAGETGGDKCIVYPGGTTIPGDVNQSTGTIRLSVPRSLLRALSGGTGPGERPTEVAATVGSRFYDATMFSLGNPASPNQSTQSFLYPLDNTPAMDFLLPAPSADLGVTKSDSPDPVKGGQNLTYTIVVTNNGPAPATGVVMTDNLPKNAGFASASTTKGSCVAKPSRALVTCNLGEMASGTSATITIVVKSPTKGSITNKASVTATSPDPNTSNNTDTETTTVTP